MSHRVLVHWGDSCNHHKKASDVACKFGQWMACTLEAAEVQAAVDTILWWLLLCTAYSRALRYDAGKSVTSPPYLEHITSSHWHSCVDGP